MALAAILTVGGLPAVGATAGTPRGAHPLPPMARGAFVVRLLAALGVPDLSHPPAVYRDVPPASPVYAAVTTAAIDGITQAARPGRFAPREPVTAQAAATMALRAYSPLAAAWASRQGSLAVAVDLGLLPRAALAAPAHPLDLLEASRLIAQLRDLHSAAGSGQWQWLAASGDPLPAAAVLDTLAAAVAGRPVSAVAAYVDPRSRRGVDRSYRHIERTFAAFAAMAPHVGWRVVGGGIFAMKPLAPGLFSADAALVLETVDPATGSVVTDRTDAWLGWPTSPYIRFDFGEVAVGRQGIVGLNALKGAVPLSSLAGAILPGVIAQGVAAYPQWSVMAVGVATAFPAIAPAAATARRAGRGGATRHGA